MFDEQTRNNAGIYVDLDAIFDTRFKMLDLADHNLVLSLMEDLRYHKRKIDSFGYITYELWSEIYRLRTSHVLEKPLFTEIPEIIGEYLTESAIAIKAWDVVGMDRKLTINIFPYELSNEDIETLRYVIGNFIGLNIEIDVVRKPRQELTTEFIYRNFGVVIMYEYMQWFEHVSSKGYFKDVTLPDVEFLAPKIFHNGDIFDKKDFDKIFEDMENMMKIFVGVKFIPIEYFCFKLPSTFKKK